MTELNEQLPDWNECSAAVNNDTATALQRFIFNQEPAGDSDEYFFRSQLAAAIGEVRRAPAAAPVKAWMHPDGRVVPASTMEVAKRYGGTMASILAVYTIPLAEIGAAAPAPVAESDFQTALRLGLAALEVATTPLPEDRQTVLKALTAMRAALAAVPAAAPIVQPVGDADELHFNATRLRNVARLVGLESAVPQDDATLDGARGSVLGMIAGKLHAAPTTAAADAAIAAAREEGRQDGRNEAQIFRRDHLINENMELRARLAAPEGEAAAALRQIADMVPATQEMSLAHEMAQIAEDALQALQPQAKAPQQPPAGEDLEGLIPTGWKICTADFSHIAAGKTKPGNVMLVRDVEGKKAWHALDEEARERTDLYIYGTGRTLREAVIHAAAQALDTQ